VDLGGLNCLKFVSPHNERASVEPHSWLGLALWLASIRYTPSALCTLLDCRHLSSPLFQQLAAFLYLTGNHPRIHPAPGRHPQQSRYPLHKLDRNSLQTTSTMVDTDMKDAPGPSTPSAATTSGPATSGKEKATGKPRFEVKKVWGMIFEF
jgi:hypothetical protein